jgi:hypothetical protein
MQSMSLASHDLMQIVIEDSGAGAEVVEAAAATALSAPARKMVVKRILMVVECVTRVILLLL